MPGGHGQNYRNCARLGSGSCRRVVCHGIRQTVTVETARPFEGAVFRSADATPWGMTADAGRGGRAWSPMPGAGGKRPGLAPAMDRFRKGTALQVPARLCGVCSDAPRVASGSVLRTDGELPFDRVPVTQGARFRCPMEPLPKTSIPSRCQLMLPETRDCNALGDAPCFSHFVRRPGSPAAVSRHGTRVARAETGPMLLRAPMTASRGRTRKVDGRPAVGDENRFAVLRRPRRQPGRFRGQAAPGARCNGARAGFEHPLKPSE